MTGDDFIESWEERVDWALGRAGRIIDYVTDTFLAGDLPDGDEMRAQLLVESWCQLAAAWQDRQRHEMELQNSLPEDEEAEEYAAT